MSNQPTPGVYIELAYNSNAFFSGSQKGDVCFRTANSNQRILFGVNTDAPAIFGMDNSNIIMNGNVGFGGSNNPSEVLDIRNGNAYFDSNVYVMNKLSIGSTLPSEYLDLLNGNAKMSSNLYVMNKATIGVTNSNPTETLDIGSNLKVRSNAYVMYRVAIGKSNPNEVLDIEGSAKIANNVYALQNLAVGSSNARENVDVIANAIIRSNAYVMSRISVGSSNPTEVLDITGNGKITGRFFVTSNIGVGSSNPTERLDIYDNTKVRGDLYALNKIVVGQGASNPNETLDVRGNTKIGAFLYVLSNVSIGNSNPTEKLDIIGNTKVQGNLYTTTRLGIGNSNPGERIDVSGNILASSNVYAMQNIGIGTVFPNERLEVTGNAKILSNLYVVQKVGIGNSNPEEKVHISGGNTKIDQNLFVMSQIGVGKSNPTESVDIIGNLKMSGNIYSMNNLAVGLSNPSEQIETSSNLKVGSNLYVISRLGVSTSNPTETADIYGNLKVSSNIYTSNAIVIGGRSNPTEKLDLVGNAKMSSNLYVLSNVSIAHSNPTEKLDIIGNLKVSSNIYTSNAIVIGGGSNPTEKLVLTGNAKMSSNLYVLNRLSINSSNPSVGLEVNTTDAVLLSKGTNAQRPSVPVLGHVRYNTETSQFEGFGAGNAWGSLGGVKSTNQQTYISAEEYPTSNDDNIRFFNSNIESMRITRTRLVGIGTTSPTEKLDVTGNVKISNNEYIMGSIGINNSNVTERLQVTSGKIYTDVQFLGNSNDSASLPTYSFKEDSNTGLFHPSNDAIGFTTNGTEKMRIDANGNIGIGKSDPSFKLDINGSVNALGYCNLLLDSFASLSTSNAPTANALKSIADTAFYTSNIIFFSGSNGSASLATMATSASNIAFWSSNNLVKSSGHTMTGTLVTPYIGVNTSSPSERLDVTGNVKVSSNVYVSNRIGVNTSNPSQAIHVVGNMRLEGNLDVNGILNTINTDVKLTDQVTVSNNGTGPALQVYQMGAQPVADFYDDATLAMRIADGGNVGIGTSTPSYKLDVNGTSRIKGTSTNGASNLLVLENQASSRIQFVDEFNTQPCGMASMDTGNGIGIYAGSSIGLFTSNLSSSNSVQRMIVTQAGNVGVGTTSPAFRFDVNGKARIQAPSSSNILTIQTSNNAIGEVAGIMLGIPSGQGATIESITGVSGITDLRFWTTACNLSITSNLTMYLSGNSNAVGIGTTNPLYKLDVAGTINSSGNLTGPTVTSLSNLGIFGSNTVISLSNYVYTTSSTNVTTANAIAISASNTAFWSSNNLVKKSGDTMTGNLDVSGNGGIMISAIHSSMVFGQNATISVGKAKSTNNIANIRYSHSNDGSSSNYVGIGFWGNDDILNVRATGNVGIGTTAPAYKLHISSNASSSGTIVSVENPNTGTDGWAAVSVRNSGSAALGGMRMGILGTGWTNTGIFQQNGGFLDCDQSNGISVAATSNSGSVRFYAGGATEVMRVSSNQNVGIGTTSPSYRLDVQHSTSANAVIRVGDTTNQFGRIMLGNSSHGIARGANIGGATDGNDVTVHTAGEFASVTLATLAGEGLRVNPSGNVGIGTNNPGHKLDVSGNIRTTGMMLLSGGSNTIQITTDDPGDMIVKQYGTSAGDRYGMGQYASGTTRLFSAGAASSSIRLSAPTNNVRSASAAFNDYLTILAGTNGNAGNVGIGTTTPGYKLDLTGDARITGSLFFGPPTGDIAPYITARTVPVGQGEANERTEMILFHGNDPGNGSGTDTITLRAPGLRFQTFNDALINNIANSNGALDRMYIDPTGNIGVGTTSPTDKLDVVGNARVSSNIYISTSYGTNYLGVGNADNATLCNYNVKFQAWYGIGFPSYDGINRISIDTRTGNIITMGKLFLGTSNTTSYELDVSGDVRVNNPTGQGSTAIMTLENSTNTNKIGMFVNLSQGSFNACVSAGDSGIFSGLGAANTGSLVLGVWGNSNAGIKIDKTGFVGIGTSTPIYKLDVQGTVGIANSGGKKLQFPNDNSTNRHIVLWETGNNEHQFYGFGIGNPMLRYQVDSTNSSHIFYAATSSSASTELMRIQGNGNVGIGTTTPSARLDVEGNVNIGATSTDYSLTSTGQFTLWGNRSGSGTFVHMMYAVGSNNSTTGDHIWYTRGNGVVGTERMRITSSGNVGIGTSSPSSSYKLDVSGNLNATTIFQNGTSLSSSYLPLSGGTLTNALTIQETTGSAGSASSGTLTLKHNNSGGSSSIIFTSTVNAGSDYGYIRYSDHDIATYFPAQNGTSEASRLTIGIENDVEPGNGETIVIKGGYGIAYDSSRHFFTGGNVGVGTSAPTHRLQVENGMTSTQGLQALQFISGRNNAYLTLSIYNTNSGTGYTNINKTNDYSTLLSYVQSATTYILWNNTLYRVSDTGNENSQIRAFNINSVIDNSAFTGSGTITFYTIQIGDVNTPTHTLSVYSPLRVLGSSLLNNALVGDTAWGNFTSFRHSSVGTNSYALLQGNNGETFLNCAPGQAIRFRENNVDKVMLSNSCMGIGTTTPTAPLHVIAGSGSDPSTNGVYVYNPTSSTSSHSAVGVRTNNSTGGNPYFSWDIANVTGWSMGISNADSDKLVIKNNWNFSGDNNVLTMLSGGNVGVGTPNPSVKLEVNGTIKCTNYILPNDIWINSSDTKGRFYFGVNGRTYYGAQDGHEWRNSGDTGQMFFTNGGNLGVGTLTPGSYRLYVSGEIYATSDITAYSDIRAKSNLERIPNSLEKIQKLNGYTYDFNTDEPSQTKITNRYSGLVAQEVEQVLPEVIHKNDDGKLSIAYGNMAGLFVESIKELKKENTELKGENQLLKDRIIDIESKVSRLETLLSTLIN
jgi:Chaperone of endosialidase/Phage T4 tail fibre